MSKDNERFQRLESDVNQVRSRISKIENRPREDTPKPSEFISKWKDPISVLTAVLAFFTGALVVTSYLQWEATKETIKDTHQGFEIGTRAWVIGRNCDIVPTVTDAPHHGIVVEGRGLKDSRNPALSMNFVNTGKSPAFNVVQRTNFELFNHLPDDNYMVPPSEPGSRHVIGPDQTVSVQRGLALTEDQYQAVSHGTLFIVVIGILTYEDIFNRSHETKYCMFYDYSSEKMGWCSHFNSAN